MRVVAERADDVLLRDARETRNANLLLAAIRVRSMVLDALGEKGLATYGLSGETPRVPRDLMNHAYTVAKLMQENPFNVTVDGVTFDSAAMATTLTTKADALATALADVQREEQELANELGKRNVAITAWGDVHQGVADTLTGLFRLALMVWAASPSFPDTSRVALSTMRCLFCRAAVKSVRIRESLGFCALSWRKRFSRCSTSASPRRRANA